jgi:hypothetical protein
MPFWDADSGEDERGAAVAVYAAVGFVFNYAIQIMQY